MPGFTIVLRRLFNSVVTIVVIAILTLPTKSPASSNSSAIAALDIRIVETLVAMDIVPTSLTDPEAQYFSTTRLMGSTNLGIGFQPNLELLSQVSPQQILVSPNLAQISARLSGISSLTSLTPYDIEKRADSWRQLTSFTCELGKHIDDERSAERLIRETEQHLHALRDSIPDNQPPLLIIRLMDNRHARVFGNSSMFQSALEQLGLTNAWQGESNHWGFTTVSIDALIDIDARLVILESPYANSPVHEQFSVQGTWQHMRSLQRGDEIYLPATFHHFGALPSALVFSEALVEALEAQNGL
ncbi:ABC transporter substrate-binding protein [Halomonas sp. ATBC28]|uniref:ABC transporter substrate-binding protein n=1 Tax=Halomonas sp. ATBC28 TaxID=2545264 RepID=UPI00110EBC87|nr:ABC transporter substrate-binding protein [Halomonas sp. ATBC28]TMU27239.1 ABC transporter substrate-binding protein [Halomonas sp. ATBC28]